MRIPEAVSEAKAVLQRNADLPSGESPMRLAQTLGMLVRAVEAEGLPTKNPPKNSGPD